MKRSTSESSSNRCKVNISQKEFTPSKRPRLEAEKICTICQETMFETPNVCKTFPCGHSYHINCAKEWLKIKPSCPNCRLKVRVIKSPLSYESKESDVDSSGDDSVQRVEESYSEVDSGSGSESESESDEYRHISGDTVLTIGQHAWKLYAVIVAEDPGYCRWVLSLKNPFGGLKGFQDYLLQLRESGQYFADDTGERKVGFGRYSDLSYDELAEQQPGYCSWVLRLKDTTGNMSRLQTYLRKKRLR